MITYYSQSLSVFNKYDLVLWEYDVSLYDVLYFLYQRLFELSCMHVRWNDYPSFYIIFTDLRQILRIYVKALHQLGTEIKSNV